MICFRKAHPIRITGRRQGLFVIQVTVNTESVSKTNIQRSLRIEEMNAGKTTFLVKQVEAEINKLFTELIDMSDYSLKKANHKKDAFNSRALAAYALHILAEVSPTRAAEAIVDGYDDNGIDALLFHPRQNTLWLVQAKWIQDGQGCPKSAELRSFKDGIFDLLDFPNKLKRFNEKFEIKEDEITSAFKSPGLKIKVVLSYTGQDLSKHARGVIDDCLDDLNNIGINSSVASFENFNLDRAFQALTDSHKQEDIEVKVSLSNWGRVEEPYQAIYGQICAVDVAKWWIQHKNKLFSKNIRDFIGGTDVNTEIEKTLRDEPGVFWYFNNGITVLCKDITKADVKKDRKIGEFIIKGISVVNGAQTIGSIGVLYQGSSPEEKEHLEEAEIFIRFISLDKCSEDFGLKVTKATNTQNRVEIRDFVALDPQQERLYKEFRSGGRNYHYKRSSDTFIRDHKNYELEEATIALACANDDINLAITAKQELSKLWSDTSQKPYTSLFNQNVHAMRLWRQVDIKRKVDELINCKQEISEDQVEQNLFKYGNLFVLHMVFKQLRKDVLSAEISENDFSSYKEIELPNLLEKVIEATKQYLYKNGKISRIWMLFNSSRISNEIKKEILSK